MLKFREWIMLGGILAVLALIFMVHDLSHDRRFSPSKPLSDSLLTEVAPLGIMPAIEPDLPVVPPDSLPDDVQKIPADHVQKERADDEPDTSPLIAGEEADRIIDSLKECRLKQELLTRSPLARRMAAGTLQRMNLPDQDLNQLRADAKGGIYYECCFHQPARALAAAVEPSTAQATLSLGTAAASVPISSPPVYHSNFGSNKVVFLDFNGGRVSGTAWNTDEYGEPDATVWVCRPYSTDADETRFSISEQEDIRRIFEIVSEDYAPFDIDVTTEEPATFTRTTGHVMITPGTDANGADLPHVGDAIGGIAYVDEFGQNSYGFHSPAWVKSTFDGRDFADVAETISHEFGHNLGLNHDGDNRSAYYRGHGSGPESWAPIMGFGSGKHVVQWSKGEYPRANNTQDDMAIIASKLNYLPDDHANTVGGTATPLNLDSSPAGSGVIGRADDVDIFMLTTGQIMELTVIPDPESPNLNCQIEILDGAGNILASDAPFADLEATLSYAPPTYGTYYIRIDGVGALGLDDGFSDYSSVGQYTIIGNLYTPVGLSTTIDSMTLQEGRRTSSIGVRLSEDPGNDLVVTAVVSGSTSIRINGNSSLIFTSFNWNVPQYVTVEAVQDDDGLDDSATITFSSASSNDAFVSVRSIDDEYQVTMLSNGGGTVTSSFGFAPGGSAVSISAAPGDKYRFSGWTISGNSVMLADPAAATTTLTAIGDETVTAIFAREPDEPNGCGVGIAPDFPLAICLVLVGVIVLRRQQSLQYKS